jgi:hypothetical protein
MPVYNFLLSIICIIFVKSTSRSFFLYPPYQFLSRFLSVIYFFFKVCSFSRARYLTAGKCFSGGGLFHCQDSPTAAMDFGENAETLRLSCIPASGMVFLQCS